MNGSHELAYNLYRVYLFQRLPPQRGLQYTRDVSIPVTIKFLTITMFNFTFLLSFIYDVLILLC